MTLRNFNWPVGTFIIGYHLALLVALPFYFHSRTPGPGLILTSLALLFLTEIGIGAAYHRYYAHRSYSMSRPAEVLLLALGNLAIQGSVLRWAHDHRLHHAYVDTDLDPYSIRRGFWYAHLLWMFGRPRPIDPQRVPDLLANRLVVLQHRHHAALGLGGNAVVAAVVGWLLGDFLGAFLLAWWTRLFVSHHLTWFVNSLAHTWGERTYSREQSAVDNYVLAFLTVGEGYHNYHHTFPSDYRNGHRWYHFDPTKWVIWSLSRLGLARGLVCFDTYRIRRRLLGEDCRLLLATLRRQGHARRHELEETITHLAAKMRAKLHRIALLSGEIEKLRRRHPGHVPGNREHPGCPRGTALMEFRALGRSLRRDWKTWSRLCSHVLEGLPATP